MDLTNAERILRLEAENVRLAGRVEQLTIAIDNVRREKSKLYSEIESLRGENAQLKNRLAECEG